jgi:uncharacterized protein YkwD
MLLEHLEDRRLLAATPTDFEQYQLELINRARADPSAEAARLGISLNEGLAAGTISTAAKQPLAFNPDLIESATGYSSTLLAAVNYFNHYYNGTTPQSRMTAAGFSFSGSYTNGENIDVQASTGPLPVSQAITNQEYEDLFIDSGEPGRGHRVNLMDGSFKEVGIGIVAGSNYQGLGGNAAYNAVLTTQDFAASDSDPDPFLTGVVFTDTAHTDFYVPGEGIGGVTIRATRAGDGQVFSTTTWSSGGYSLAVPAGTYTVAASGGGLSATVSYSKVVVGSLNVEEDFTAPPATGTLEGTIFDDHNKDGIREKNDQGLAGITIILRRIKNGNVVGKALKAVSNHNGKYELANLAPGIYRASEAVPAGDILTTPTGGTISFHVSAGQTVSDQNFGDYVG